MDTLINLRAFVAMRREDLRIADKHRAEARGHSIPGAQAWVECRREALYRAEADLRNAERQEATR